MNSKSDNWFEGLTPEELDSLAPRELRIFYDNLEMRCKRFQPKHFVPAVTALMREQERKGRFVYAPPHQVAMMIEAVCAFTRGQNNDQLTWDRYAKIKNLFSEKRDPALHAAIHRGIDWFILVMQREQTELQRGQSVYDVSNSLDLYNNTSLATEMESHLGMSPDRWISVSLAIWSTICNPETITTRPVITQRDKDQIQLTEEELRLVFSRMSRTPIEIGERFKKVREDTAPKYHSHIRSTFIDKPYVDLGDVYCSPFPGVAFRAMFSELYSVAKTCTKFDPEFSLAMENIVEKTLRLIPKVGEVWTNTELERLSHGKSCDFVVECEDCNLFLECKAASFTRNVVIPRIIETDGSTRALQDAHIQLHQTCKNYHENGIQNLIGKRDVPCVGIAVTFGDVPSSNAPWYYERFLKDRVERKVGAEELQSFAGREIPFSLSLETLQVLVVYLRESGASILDTVKDYCSQQYVSTGDWDAFLQQRLENESNSDSGLPFVKANSNLAFSRILPSLSNTD